MSQQSQPQLQPSEASERPVSGDEQTNVQQHTQTRLVRYALIGLAMLVVIAVALTAVWWFKKHAAHKSAGAPAYSGRVENITVANIGEYSIFNLIAHDKGFFAKQGLHVTLNEYPSGPPAIADLLAGKADFAVAADFVGVSNIFKSDQLRILSEASEQDNFRLLARKDHGVLKQADLKGKKIAVTKKTAGEFFLERFLSLNGLTMSDVEEVDRTPADIVSQLTAGQLDAAIIFEPHAYKLQQSLGDKIVSWSAQGNEKAIAVVYTTQNRIQAKPDVAVRYLKALSEAEEYVAHNQQESKNILMKTMGYDQAYVNYMWPKFDFSLTLNQELLLTMEDQARFLIMNHAVSQTQVPNYLDYIYFGALQKAKPDGVNIEH